MKKLLRKLPAIHSIQKESKFCKLVDEYQIPFEMLTEWAQEEINTIRSEILQGTWSENIVSSEDVTSFIFEKLLRKSELFIQTNLRQVINATGTILHTNLGRARLSEEAINHVVMTAKNYSNLEYDLEKGERGSRHSIIESLLTQITGAEAAMVVNNNAAAVYLTLRALAKGKEVIVSRGELIEIGGSFRISAIMEESDAFLKEVGTTNKTHFFDYADAINEQTAILMKVHTSNFKTIGFTHSVSTEQLVELAKKSSNLIVYEDLGSGAFYDFGIGEEPVVSEVLKTGVDLVSFSGDKLLGGPQAGIIAGKKELIHKLKKHQLARVLRVDKMTLAALESTIKSYLQKKEKDIPTVRDFLLPISEIKNRIASFLEGVNHSQNKNWKFTVKEDTSQIGGGTMPDVQLPTFVVAVTHNEKDAQSIFNDLRNNNPAILARLKKEEALIDFRTITEDEIPHLIKFFRDK